MKRSGAPNDLSGTPQPPPFSDPPSSSHGFGRGGRKRKKRQLLSKKQAQQSQQQQQQQPKQEEEEVGGAGGGEMMGKDWVHPVKAKRKSSFPSQPVLKLAQHIEVRPRPLLYKICKPSVFSVPQYQC